MNATKLGEMLRNEDPTMFDNYVTDLGEDATLTQIGKAFMAEDPEFARELWQSR